MNAVTKNKPSQEVVPAEPGANLLDVISIAASNPAVDIDKLERLISLQERLEARDAKVAFTEAKIAMRPHLPEITMKGLIVIKKDGKIVQETPFARFEDLHELVTPILTEYGFDLKFRNGLSDDGKVRVTTILAHRGGHEEDTYFDLPHDSTGSKNPVQAVGSSTSYGKRYGTINVLNLRIVGEDDDGVSAMPETVVEKARDLPFPQGPAKNKTDLKDKGRALWRDIEACSDLGSFNSLLDDGAPLIAQLKEALPSWWRGGQQGGETFEGLEHVIDRVRRDLNAAEQAQNYLQAG